MLLLFHVSLCPSQSARHYEQRCREADEVEQTAEKMSNTSTATPKQIDKVTMCSSVIELHDECYLCHLMFFKLVHT